MAQQMANLEKNLAKSESSNNVQKDEILALANEIVNLKLENDQKQKSL
jgi:hypothetical protein